MSVAPFADILNAALQRHGKGWVDRLLIGSVTEDLLNNLPCAVLVVPVPKPARRESVAHHSAAAVG